MSDYNTAELLAQIRDEIRGLREDSRRRGGLPDVRIGKCKKCPEYEGKVASECPADALLEYASFLEWKADKGREEGKMQYVASNEREALMCRRWATVNRGLVAAPEKMPFRRPAPQEDAPPDTQNSRQAQPTTETRAKWTSGGTWKKASGG